MPKTIFNLKIFKGIEESVVEEIILGAIDREYKQGDIIIKEGDESNGEGYIVKSGKIKISIIGQKVAELGKGDIVGEIALLNEEKRTATVEALEDTEVIVLTLNHLIDMINNDDNSINKMIINRIEENIENA